jgi:peptide/nickel transport system substrate-binding protein
MAPSVWSSGRFISRRYVLSASAGLACLAAPGLPCAALPKRGGMLRVAAGEAKTIEPLRMNNSGAIAMVQQVAEYLAWVEQDLSLRPVLATGWTTPDGGRSWLFDIRQGVAFHDGQELTADDVVASFRRFVDPASASPGAAQLSFLRKDGISRTGPHQVRFELDRPISQFPYYTTNYNAAILPAGLTGSFADSPIGTGPFKLAGYKPGESASFVRNERYWQPEKPSLDRVEFGFYDSPQAMVIALQGEQADLIVGTSYFDTLPLLGSSEFRILSTRSSEHRQLTMRVDRKPFDDKRVRQAVALCMRRPELIKGLLGGRGDIGNDHLVAPIYPVAIDVPQRTWDLAPARQLLTEAGYPNGFDVDLYTANYLELPAYAQLIEQMLRPAGIRTRLRIEPTDTYYQHWTEVAFGLTDWTSRPVPEQLMSEAFRSGSESNAAKWKNPEFDKVLQDLEAEADPSRRSALAQQAAATLHDEVPAVVAYFTGNLRPVRSQVQGVEAHISQFLDLTNAWLG